MCHRLAAKQHAEDLESITQLLEQNRRMSLETDLLRNQVAELNQVNVFLLFCVLLVTCVHACMCQHARLQYALSACVALFQGTSHLLSSTEFLLFAATPTHITGTVAA